MTHYRKIHPSSRQTTRSRKFRRTLRGTAIASAIAISGIGVSTPVLASGSPPPTCLDVEEIETPADLEMLRDNDSLWGCDVTLMNDITITTGLPWRTTIGDANTPFDGIFEGNGKTITFEHGAGQ